MIALLAVRLWALLAVQVAWRRAVGPLWVVVSAGLAVVVSVAVTAGTADPLGVPTLGGVLIEAAIGTGIGLLASLPGYALVGAMDQSQSALGLTRDTGGTLVAVALALATGTALALDLHHAAIAALVATLEWMPVGADVLPWAGLLPSAQALIDAAHHLLFLGLSLATPVLLVVAIVDVVTALLGREGPLSIPIEATGAWARVAVALAALAASWATHPEAWVRAVGV